MKNSKINHTLIGLLMSLFLYHTLLAQEENIQVPVVGQKVPKFLLKDVKYYPYKTVSNEDLEGQWVILDFFSKGCSSCFASFPKVNKLAAEYKNKVEIILVGSTSGAYAEGIQQLYEKHRKHNDLKIPVAFVSDIIEQWKIRFYPRVVWINPQGIVKAVTATMTSENIQAFIEGKAIEGRDASYQAETNYWNSYTPLKLLLEEGNGGSKEELLYQSTLLKFKPGIRQQDYESIDQRYHFHKDSTIFQVTGCTLEMLYEYAYYGKQLRWPATDYGKIYHRPILELKDISIFEDYSYNMGKNLFCYSVKVPPNKASTKQIMAIMQNELKNYFGYEVRLENRKVPYWSLTIEDKWREKLRTKGGAELRGDHLTGGTYQNSPIKSLIRAIGGTIQGGPPVIDETGINYNIDLTLDVIMTDFESIIKGLKKNGLILEKGEKIMPALVIRDSEEEPLLLEVHNAHKQTNNKPIK